MVLLLLLLRSPASSSSSFLPHALRIPSLRVGDNGSRPFRCNCALVDQNWAMNVTHGQAHNRTVNAAAMDSDDRGKSSKVLGVTPELEPNLPDSDMRDGVKVRKTMLSKLGQSVNVAGIQFTSKVILWEQHLAIPHINVPDIRWIDWKALKNGGFEGVVFDKDNTLTAPHALAIWPPLLTSLQECLSLFEGRVALLSNSAGLFQFDPDGAEAKALEERLGIPVIRHRSKKPAGTAEDLAKHFACDPSRLVMVGDRYFIDVVFGNKNGLLTIRPAPLTFVGEPFIVQKVRKFEEAAVRRWQKRKVQPKEHVLFTSPHDFMKDAAS